MATLDLDEVLGTNATKHIIQGTMVTRMATISNLGVTGNVGTLFEAAMNFLVSQVGPLGSPCPNVTDPTYLEAFVPESVSTDIVKIRLIYKGYPALQTEISSTIAQIPTGFDKDGFALQVKYKYSDKFMAALKGSTPTDIRITVAAANGGYDVQGKMLHFNTSDTVITFRFTTGGTSGASAASNVMQFANTYIGKVNSVAWSSVPSGMSMARCWLCESLRAISHDRGLTYEVILTFHYRPLVDGNPGWDETIFYTIPETGCPPPTIGETGSDNSLATDNPPVLDEVPFPPMPPPGP